METRLLFTSINWRANVVKRFVQTYAEDTNIKGAVFTADTDPLAAGTYFSDRHFPVPYYRDPAYRPALEALLQENRVDLLLPNTDRDLDYFQDYQEELLAKGTRVCMAEGWVVEILNDKQKTCDYLTERNIPTPATFSGDRLAEIKTFPAILKPRRDSGSNQVFVVENAEELAVLARKVKDPVAQPFLQGREYTVDVLGDFEGRPVAMVPRERLGIKAGTSVKTRTLRHPELLKAARAVWECLPLRGPGCMQFLETEEGLFFLEANPRLGSGVLASIEAGLDLPRWLPRLHQGEPIALKDDFYEAGLTLLYYHESLFLREGDVHD